MQNSEWKNLEKDIKSERKRKFIESKKGSKTKKINQLVSGISGVSGLSYCGHTNEVLSPYTSTCSLSFCGHTSNYSPSIVVNPETNSYHTIEVKEEINKQIEEVNDRIKKYEVKSKDELKENSKKSLSNYLHTQKELLDRSRPFMNEVIDDLHKRIEYLEFLTDEKNKIEEKQMSETNNKVERMGRDDSNVSTRLLDKNYSPLIVRKYQMEGWPLFCGIIADISLSDLDKEVYRIADEWKSKGLFKNDIQAMRNFTGYLSDELIKHYDSVKRGSVEGMAILYYVDKTFISSLWGDFMVHASCKQELYFIVNTLPHI